MKAHIDNGYLVIKDREYKIGVQVTKEIADFVVENSGIEIENRLGMKGNIVGIKGGLPLYDFRFYTIADMKPKNKIPKGVYTKGTRICYKSFLLIQDEKLPCAKCLKCGKLITGNLLELERHIERCPKQHLADGIDHTWRLYGNFKYHSQLSRDKTRESTKFIVGGNKNV